jgi:glycosyltransferase involved in cell wall biosynthesis
MKILVISQYYYPEPGASTHRLTSVVEAMVKRGHEVTVICEFPNHPTGVLDRKDRWRLFRIEKNESYRIIRTFVLAFARKNNIKRLLFYLSFSLSSFLGAIFLRRHEVIFTSSPPIFHVFFAMLAAKLKRSRFALDIRDIWPEGVLGAEVVSDSRLLKWGGYLERNLYKNAEVISATTKGQKRTIEQRGGAGKASVIYNGSDDYALNWRGDYAELRRSLGWENKIIVCFTGLIGLVQNLACLVPEMARIEGNDVKFVFIGNGPGESELRQAVSENHIKNVEFINMMPRPDVIRYIYASDIMLAVIRESEFFKITIPFKVYDYMAVGKPIVTNVDGELREIITANNVGIYFSLSDKGSFGRAIEKLKTDSELRYKMGVNGKKTVEKEFLRPKLSEKLVEKIENITGRCDDRQA